MTKERISDQDLHAFIDGELDETRAAQTAAQVAATPDLAERVARFRRDKAQLARIFGPLIEQPLPQQLRQPFETAAARALTWRAKAVSAAAAMAALAIFGWFAASYFSGPGPDALVAEAIAARSGALHPAQEFAATTVTTPEARDRVVQSTLALALKTPDLGKAGYVLTTMSVYANHTQAPAIQLSYRNAEGRLFTVYLHRPAGSDRFELIERGTTRICIWENEDLGAVMVGEMSSQEMLRVASLTYADLNF
jgi:anti-sigma factor RsiW